MESCRWIQMQSRYSQEKRSKQVLNNMERIYAHKNIKMYKQIVMEYSIYYGDKPHRFWFI
ncbi:MAG: hypothetical protein QG641_2504 [Candidatus Poribacteria bacterium]|nr:hypothetical protein [Candidatus Poribacteria bacterium]